MKLQKSSLSEQYFKNLDPRIYELEIGGRNYIPTSNEKLVKKTKKIEN